MSSESEIAAARAELTAVRDRMSDTAAELEAKFTAPVAAVKDKLDVVQLVRDHPWPALAIAVGVGAAIAASGADRRAASVTVDATRRAAKASAETIKAAAKSTASATADTARHGPSRARGAIVGALDGLAAKLAVSLIERLREPAAQPASPEPAAASYAETGAGAATADSAPV